MPHTRRDFLTMPAAPLTARLLSVRFEPRYRHAPEKVLVHAPPLPGLSRVRVNGRLVPLEKGRPTVL